MNNSFGNAFELHFDKVLCAGALSSHSLGEFSPSMFALKSLVVPKKDIVFVKSGVRATQTTPSKAHASSVASGEVVVGFDRFDDKIRRVFSAAPEGKYSCHVKTRERGGELERSTGETLRIHAASVMGAKRTGKNLLVQLLPI